MDSNSITVVQGWKNKQIGALNLPPVLNPPLQFLSFFNFFHRQRNSSSNKSQGAHLRLKDEHDWRKCQELLHQSYRGLHDSRLPGESLESPPRWFPIFSAKKKIAGVWGGFSGLHPDFEENGCHLCQQKEDQKLARVDILPSFCHYRPDRIRESPIPQKIEGILRKRIYFESHVENYFWTYLAKSLNKRFFIIILLCILVLLLIYLFFSQRSKEYAASHYSKIPALRFGCPQCTSPSVTNRWKLDNVLPGCSKATGCCQLRSAREAKSSLLEKPKSEALALWRGHLYLHSRSGVPAAKSKSIVASPRKSQCKCHQVMIALPRFGISESNYLRSNKEVASK